MRCCIQTPPWLVVPSLVVFFIQARVGDTDRCKHQLITGLKVPASGCCGSSACVSLNVSKQFDVYRSKHTGESCLEPISRGTLYSFRGLSSSVSDQNVVITFGVETAAADIDWPLVQLIHSEIPYILCSFKSYLWGVWCIQWAIYLILLLATDKLRKCALVSRLQFHLCTVPFLIERRDRPRRQ